MKQADLRHLVIVVIAVALLSIPVTGGAFFGFFDRYPLMGGFVKFFLFASYGDVLSRRIKAKDYRVKGLFYKALVWGLIGVVIVWIFAIYTQGIALVQARGLLPGEGSTFWFAFWVSLFMNVTFAPTMMLCHRMSDHYIEHRVQNPTHTFAKTIVSIDYPGFMRFVVFKTLPFFWIPAHTITFILPERYRVFFAALLGIALGLLLGLAKQNKPKEGH